MSSSLYRAYDTGFSLPKLPTIFLGNFDDFSGHSSLIFRGSFSLHYTFFVQFIALILTSALRREMRRSKLIEKYTVRELLLEMDPLTKIRYAGKYGQILTEVTKPQREILELLNMESPVVA
jgi:hypothetical protein